MLIRNQHCNVSCPVFLKKKNDSGNLSPRTQNDETLQNCWTQTAQEQKQTLQDLMWQDSSHLISKKHIKKYQCLWHNKPCPTKHWPTNPHWHCCSMFVAFRRGPSRHRTSWRQFREKSAYKHGRRSETPWHILTKWLSQNGSFGGFGPLLFNMILHLKIHLALCLGTGKYIPNFSQVCDIPTSRQIPTWSSGRRERY